MCFVRQRKVYSFTQPCYNCDFFMPYVYKPVIKTGFFSTHRWYCFILILFQPTHPLVQGYMPNVRTLQINTCLPDVRSKLCFQGHSKVTFWHRVYWKLSFCVTSSVYFRGDSEIVDWRDIGAQWKRYFGDTLNWMDLGWILELHCFAWRVGGIPDVGSKSQNMVSHILDCH